MLCAGCGAEPAPRKLSFLLEGRTFFKRLPLPPALGSSSQPWKSSRCFKKTPNFRVTECWGFPAAPVAPAQPILNLLETPGQPHLGRVPTKDPPRVMSPPHQGLGWPWDTPGRGSALPAQRGLAIPGSPVATAQHGSEPELLPQTEGVPLPRTVRICFEVSCEVFTFIVAIQYFESKY